jgi:signal peptidase II
LTTERPPLEPPPEKTAEADDDVAPKPEQHPMAEPSGQTAEDSTTADSSEEPAEAPRVPGERLGVPLGATRVIADYGRPRPSLVFLALVSIVTLAADVASKAWAASHLDGYPGSVEVWKNHVTLILAKNRGGAWGLLQSTSENVRRPFFLLVSVAAIVFIMTLYQRLQAKQRALKWGLPLVLGGALGNVLDRVRYGHVIDFIDVHAVFRSKLLRWEYGEHHWPTFNIADVAICVGVGLMAVDMFTSKRVRPAYRAPHVPPAQSGEPSADWNGLAAAAPLADASEPPHHEAPGEPPPVLPDAPAEAASKE